MLNMIKSDLYRIFKGKGIYIAILIVLIMCFTSAISMQAGCIGVSTSTSMNEEEVEFYTELSNAKSIKDYRSIMKSQGDVELDKEVIAQNTNLYYTFIIIVVIVLCSDFSTKSVKNTLSSSISRKKYYLSKIILIFGLCTFIILFSNYFFYFLNYIMNGTKFVSSIGEVTKLTMIQFPLLYGIISLLICLAFIVKRTAVFNTIAIPLQMLVQVVVMTFTSLFRIKADWFYSYELQYALSRLANSPSTSFIINCAILGCAYIIVFNLIAYLSFKNTEIK